VKPTMTAKIWLIALLLSAPRLCSAQGNEMVIESRRANSLSGVVVDQAGDPFPKVAVHRIECGAGEFRGTGNSVILQKAETDAKGNFAFLWKGHNRTCLQVMAPGFNKLQVEVKYARGGGNLKLILHVGT
jgi:hypothetical protein